MPASTELRHDPVLDRLVIVAAGRSARPHTVAVDAAAADAGPAACPFCPGHEAETPPELVRTGRGAPGAPGWRVRVFPNLYPIVGGPAAGKGVTGAHEVVVLSPDHHRSFGALTDDAACEVVRMLRDRVRVQVDAGHAYAVALMNHRRAAGASIAHPHAQVVALDFVPPEVQAAARRAAACDDLLDRDLSMARSHDTVVCERGAVAWLPHAGGSAFVVRIADPGVGAGFDTTADDALDRVALVLRDVLARLHAELGDPPYNVTFHTAAADGTGPRRWYAEITPRLSVVAGFEMATGLLVNTTPPEAAAAVMRGEAA